MPNRLRWAPAILLIAAVLFPSHLRASQVRLIDLEQMTKRAARIFSGHCTRTQVVFDASIGRDVTVTTFMVDRAVKGIRGKTVTVRTLGSSAPGEAPSGVPTFRAGEEVVLFLYGESAQGLSSPVGLGQGRFRVISDKQGRKLAFNDFGNKQLLSRVRPEILARMKVKDDASPGRKVPREDEGLDSAGLLDAAEQIVAASP